MRKLIGTLIISFLTATVFSQTNVKITGTVADGGIKKIESATISLHKAADSSVLKMTVANKDGKYEFENISPGRYFVSVSMIGHGTGYSKTFDLNDQPVVVEQVELVAQAKDLSGVTVTGRRPFIEQKIDRMVVNVDAAVTNVGATALEVLEKSPGITVDKDGNISLKGKQSVQVYLDGKPSYLSGQELVNLLNNMNANQLDQIEIMTNPPAKYDAAGNSGIINIKTKKNRQVGFNGTASAGYSQGKYWRTNESLNLNYRNGKVNTFLNYNFSKNNRFQKLNIHRTYLHADKTVDALFDQTAFMPQSYQNNSLKIGMDIFATNKTTYGFVVSGFENPEHERNYNTAFLKEGDGTLDSIVYATSDNRNKWKNKSANVNFRHQFDSAGTELTVDLDYADYSSHSKQLFSNTNYFPDWSEKGRTELMGDLPVDIDIYSAKFDFALPTKKGWKIEAGAKTSYVSTDNAAFYFNLVGVHWEPDYNKTNQFIYKENINAGYLNFSRQFKKFGFQGGLRFENTNYKGRQLGNPQRPDSSFSNDYNSLFPTFYISYNASEKHQFGINVGRRIDRPAYQDLNPFLYFLDNYTYESGNPFIRPQYTLNLEVSHTFKGFLNTTLNYSRTKDFMTETFEQSNYATIVREGNIGERRNAGLSVSAQVTVKKWWTTVLYGNYNYNAFEGELYGEMVKIDASNFLFNVNNQFRFGKGWSAELSGFYRSKGVEGQIIIQPMGQLHAGVSKTVLKGKGTVRVNVRDILYTSAAIGNIEFQRTKAYFENYRDTRVAGIAFTYRFGKPMKAAPSRKTGGAEDELNRVKTGDN